MVYLLAEFRYVVPFHQPEVGQWYRSGELPSLASPDESPLELLDKVQEPILIGERATTISRSRVLPVQIQAVKVILVEEIYGQNSFKLQHRANKMFCVYILGLCT